jgi:hypothetical protein
VHATREGFGATGHCGLSNQFWARELAGPRLIVTPAVATTELDRAFEYDVMVGFTSELPAERARIQAWTEDGTAVSVGKNPDFVAATRAWETRPNFLSAMRVKIKGDRTREADETFKVHIRGSVNGVVFEQRTVTVTILNDDVKP